MQTIEYFIGHSGSTYWCKKDSEKTKIGLVIIDSLQEYFGSQPDMLFKRNLVNYAKQTGKNGISIIGDIDSIKSSQ